MLGSNNNLCLMKVILGVAILVFTTEWTIAQVVIVPRRLSSVGTKPKVKAKKKLRGSSEQHREQIAETLPLGNSVISPLQLNFAITPPAIKKPDAGNVTSAKAWPELLGYEFDVINVDDKGRLGERRKERARFFVEAMGGGVNLEMVEIQAGAFLMGSNPIDLEQIENNYARNLSKDLRPEVHAKLLSEMPQQTVKVGGFYLSKYEVTQAQWRAVAALPKISRELMSDPSEFKGGNRPVEQISWEDAVEFCERLSRATGRRYRLPTEAEWEYACRAGASWQFSFGGTANTDWVNYNGKLPYAAAPKDTFRQQTIPTGSLGVANAFGLYDMHGNVWEWCQDSWSNNHSVVALESENKAQTEVTIFRVLRGGAWDSPAGECRSSARKQAPASLRLSNIGFRVVAETEALVAGQ
ncbi:MAG: formylglycine-generating enzyme family protein [Blastocatellia bacterium]